MSLKARSAAGNLSLPVIVEEEPLERGRPVLQARVSCPERRKQLGKSSTSPPPPPSLPLRTHPRAVDRARDRNSGLVTITWLETETRNEPRSGSNGHSRTALAQEILDAAMASEASGVRGGGPPREYPGRRRCSNLHRSRSLVQEIMSAGRSVALPDTRIQYLRDDVDGR